MNGRAWAALLLVFGMAACRHARVSTAGAPQVSRSFQDLRAGAVVRIVVPLVRSGDLRPNLQAESNAGQGKTILLKADDLLGYRASQYTVAGKQGRVRLHFLSAEETRDGKSEPVREQMARLPFALPAGAKYIRLVYLSRVSEADHNMAILSARRLPELRAFTERLERDPRVCSEDGLVTCVWVPTGVAVQVN